MNLHPYLIFNGQAREALKLYTSALNIEHGEINSYKNSPVPHLPKHSDWIVHTDLIFNGNVIAMMADSPDLKLVNNPNVHLSLNFTNLEEMNGAFERLSHEGKITMPLEKQFWNATFGQLIDKFGIHWMMNCQHD